MDSLISESARQPSDAEAILWPGQLEQLHVTWTWSLPSHRIKQRLSEVRWWGILLKLFSTCEVTLRPQKTNQMSNKPRFPQQSKPSVYSFVHIVAVAVCELGFKFSCPHFGQDWAIEFVCHFRMVYPNRMLGQQLLDAGIVQFAPGSQLDVQKSMGAWGCERETVIRAWLPFTSWPMTNR